jgi:hypothetical protein
MKYGSPNFLQPSGPFQVCYEIALPLQTLLVPAEQSLEENRFVAKDCLYRQVC